MKAFWFALLVLASSIVLPGCKGPQEYRDTFDSNGNGTIDTWRYYRNGILVRTEFDTDEDGKIDMWEYYADMKIVRRDFDRNRDGKVDRQVFLKEGRERLDDDFDGKFERIVVQ